MEWVYNPETRKAGVVPTTQWFSDGTALFVDNRLPAKERILERLDPKTGKRSPLCDVAKLRESLKTLRGSENIPMPTFNRQGSYGIYETGDAIQLLDVAQSSVKVIIKGVTDEYTRPKKQHVGDITIYLAQLKENASTRDYDRVVLAVAYFENQGILFEGWGPPERVDEASLMLETMLLTLKVEEPE
ncbi:MAG: hypothetical protein HUU38_24305 [Anaerolineales bacterium]|nr:hypothetical protein [Anaerolineales bacterium]